MASSESKSGGAAEQQEEHPFLTNPKNLKSIWRVDKWLPEFLRHQRGLPNKFRRLSLPLLAEAIRRKNVFWPRMIARYVRGKDVLDVGCGRSIFSVSFLFAGANSYTGVDPVVELDSKVIKDSSGLHGKFIESQYSPADVMRILPDVTYVSGMTSDLPEGSQFDLLAMHNVTEHLMAIEKSFEEFASLIRPGGRIAFRHPNFYCWGGHHMKPRSLGEIIPGDAEQAKYMGWEHLVPREDWPDKILKRQNRIRLAALRELVDRHFEIELWQTERSRPHEGAERMTPEILKNPPTSPRRSC